MKVLEGYYEESNLPKCNPSTEIVLCENLPLFDHPFQHPAASERFNGTGRSLQIPSPSRVSSFQ